MVQLVVVGASTGGPAALADLLGELPGDLAAAVLVVQHMADGFLPGFALWLDALSALDVRLGAPGMLLAPGTVTLAPEGHNATVASGLRLCCQPAPVGQLHVPGVDAAFESVASLLGAAAIGVVLSGMGRDGAAGLKQLHDRGAVTYCQDAASCAVYGMPGAAHALGAVDFELPPAQIGAAILARSGRRARVAPPAAFDPASGAQVGW